MTGHGFSVWKSLEVTPTAMPEEGGGKKVTDIKIDITDIGYQDVN
jgi:hypothetical protein